MDNYAFLRDQALFPCVHSGPHPYSGGKGGTMYILYELENGTMMITEATVESIQGILDYDRKVANADRKERHHAPYSIDAMDFEGIQFADHETPEGIILEKEKAAQINKKLTVLTWTQLRRALKRREGKSVRTIAAEEGTSVNAVEESLLQARKKLEKSRELF